MVPVADTFKLENPALVTGQVIDTIADFFSGRQIKSYLMGGAVRDALLERTPNDLDLVVESDQLFELVKTLSITLGGRLVILDESRSIFRRCAFTGTD